MYEALRYLQVYEALRYGHQDALDALIELLVYEALRYLLVYEALRYGHQDASDALIEPSQRRNRALIAP